MSEKQVPLSPVELSQIIAALTSDLSHCDSSQKSYISAVERLIAKLKSYLP